MPVAVHVTCASEEEASRIARLAVERRLCAFAHITPVRSIYRWQEKVTCAEEVTVLLGTVRARVPALRELVDAEHSYELPAFYVTETSGGSGAYLAWVAQNSQDA